MRQAAAIAVALLLPAYACAESVDYARDIKALLKERCFACHGALAQKANLRLDSGLSILKGGKHGPAVKRGQPAASLLLDRVQRNAEEEGGRMPPDGKPLSAEQIAKLTGWIEQGANFPATDKPEADPRAHWAFRPPRRPNLPTAEPPSPLANPIDAILVGALDRHGLVPVGPADKAALLRRVYLDLTGLPPTRAELHAFLADSTPDAYEKVVDRLLDSPAYGERWARHWMDVWRYSDWYGRRSVPDVLNSYGMMFRWRDWIIRSLNEDRGYDWMIQQMLAADELNPGDDANLVATGFVARNFYRWNYNSWMKDLVEHTGKAFLGLTFNCCHCHDHKYDPIAHREYFAFRAFFEPLEMRHQRVAGEPDPGPFPKYDYGKSYAPIQSGAICVVNEKPDAKTFMYTGGDARQVIAGKPPVTPAAPAFLGGDRLKIEPIVLPPTVWYPGLKAFVQQEETAKCAAAVQAADTVLRPLGTRLRVFERAGQAAGVVAWFGRQEALLSARAAEARLNAAQAGLASLTARIAADRARFLGGPGNGETLARVAGKTERTAAHAAALAALASAEVELLAARRDPKARTKATALTKQVEVARQKLKAAETALAGDSSTYTPLGPVYPRTSSGRRTALARWIACRDNPLTARVAVNYIWGWHFGRPIVESTHDLGRNGKRPSHPELLDWLAVEFMDNAWSIKHLNRLIVTTSTYRMQSRAPQDHAGRNVDPDNKLLWHFPTLRMEAEEVRDGLLCVAGELDWTVGGRELPQEEGLTTRRRSVYYATHGETRMQFLDLFDAADPCECYRRTTSVRPQQALALINSEFSARLGRVVARKLWAQMPNGLDKEGLFVRAAFEQVLARPPSAAEQSAAGRYLHRESGVFRSIIAGQLAAATVESSAPSPDAEQRARENLVQALLNHNDFVTIR